MVRRRLELALLLICLGWILPANAVAVEIETKSLDELYADALAEGGKLVLRAGGDKSDQIDYYLNKFKERFPEVRVDHQVDVSLNHAPRYDNALALRDDSSVPDVIQFQTLHDFEYYAERGQLEPYKPKNWDKVYPDHKDPHGRWTSVYGVTFSNLVNLELVDEAPRDALDYLDPELKGKIDGMAMRVPVPDGSLVDFTLKLSRSVTVDDINQAMYQAAETNFKDIVQCCEDPIVSSDIIGNCHSSIYDVALTQVMDDSLVKVVSWYDNEWGYSSRVAQLIDRLATMDAIQ